MSRLPHEGGTTDRGAATVLVLAVAALVGVLAVTCGLVAVLMIGRAQVQRTADLAALAAAPIRPEPPCTAAARVAAMNRAKVAHCTWSQGIATVVVLRPTPWRVIPEVRATARAQAIPPPMR